MRRILPSDFGRKWFTAALLATLASAGCRSAPPPVPPGEPIPAEPDLVVGTMDQECDALVAAVTAYGTCSNATDAMHNWALRVTEIARQAFDAGKQGDPDQPSQHVIALACRRATVSMRAATVRCEAGPLPKTDD